MIEEIRTQMNRSSGYTFLPKPTAYEFARRVLEAFRGIPAVPHGWAIVPINPTPEMIDCAKGNSIADLYRAMLAAAPKLGE